MFNITESEVNELAKKNSFNRNMTEKVLRLYSILEFLNKEQFEGAFSLKGGTAINLFLLDLPRLSVDIDLDFNLPLSKEEMLVKRNFFNVLIQKYMEENNYSLSDKSKFIHSLDSFVYAYTSTSGAIDSLKIEINYSDRVHVLKSIKSPSSNKLNSKITVMRLSDEELIGSKINALIARTTPRDVYDVYTLFKTGHVKNESLIRKISIFYLCLASEIPIDIERLLATAIEKINNLTFQKIKQALIPVLHKGIVFNVKETTSCVAKELKRFFILDENDRTFIEKLNHKTFDPTTLFASFNVQDVSNHPMGIWKTK